MDEIVYDEWEVVSLGPPAPGWRALIIVKTEEDEEALLLFPVECWGVCRYREVHEDRNTGRELFADQWRRAVQAMVSWENELVPFEHRNLNRGAVGLVPPRHDPKEVWETEYPDKPMPTLIKDISITD